MRKLVTVTAETAVAARILATLAISLNAPVRRFKAIAEYAGILDMRDEAGAARNSIIKHYNGKSR
jgi:hypothetical protein